MKSHAQSPRMLRISLSGDSFFVQGSGNVEFQLDLEGYNSA